MAYTPTSTRGIAAAASKNPTTSVTSSPETQRVTFNNKRFSVPVGSSKEYIQARASNIDATNRGGTQTDLTQFQNPTSNTSVNSTNMGNTGLILPYTPAPVKTSDVGANNAGLIEGLPGYTYQNGAFTQTPTDTTGATTPLADQVSSYLKSQKDFVGTPPSAEKIYQQSGAAERDAAKQLVNTYTGQLNTIVANRDASNLALTGQGRGIPEAIIGGQQAQISKEAAINALPIQALLANAQGNYELAQTHLDETFKIRMADATSQYQYRSDLYKSVYDIADKAQQRQLDAKQKTADQNFSLYRDFINFNRDAYKTYGIVAGSVLAKLPTLDTSDPNFMQNFSNQQSEASKIYSKFAVSEVTNEVPDKIISKIQQSSEYKTITGVMPAIQTIKDYMASVNDSGTYEFASGTKAGTKKATYGNAIAAWKTLAGLGALSGADFGLAENVIPEPAFFARKSTFIAQLNSALDNAVKQTENLTTRLNQNYPIAAPLLNAQLDDVKVIAYPDKYVKGPDGLVYEVTK